MLKSVSRTGQFETHETIQVASASMVDWNERRRCLSKRCNDQKHAKSLR